MICFAYIIKPVAMATLLKGFYGIVIYITDCKTTVAYSREN